MMHGNTKLKFIDAKQARDIYNYKKSVVIKSASCGITSVFGLILYYDARKHKIKICPYIQGWRIYSTNGQNVTLKDFPPHAAFTAVPKYLFLSRDQVLYT